MKNTTRKENRTMKVHYTIVDGEHEYCETIFIKSDGENKEDQAYKELAAMYADDAEDEREIMAAFHNEGIAMIGCRAIKNVTVIELDEVTVFVRGGVIQDIQNIPAGVRIRVQDYDVDNLTEQELREETEMDEEGDPCMVSVWESE